MMKNKLKPKEQKNLVLLCGPLSRKESVPVDNLSVGEASIPFSSVVKTLGVTVDAALSFDQQSQPLSGPAFFMSDL